MFGVFVLFIAIILVATVAYFVYIHFFNSKPVWTAKVKIPGTGFFLGNVGVEGNTMTIEGQAPITVEVPFTRSDYVVAEMRRFPDTVEIRVDDEVVSRASVSPALVMWEVPRDYDIR